MSRVRGQGGVNWKDLRTVKPFCMVVYWGVCHCILSIPVEWIVTAEWVDIIQALCMIRKELPSVHTVASAKHLYLLKITGSCAQGKSVPTKGRDRRVVR